MSTNIIVVQLYRDYLVHDYQLSSGLSGANISNIILWNDIKPMKCSDKKMSLPVLINGELGKCEN